MYRQKAARSRRGPALSAIKRYVGGGACYHQFPRMFLLGSSVNKPCATSGRRAGGVLGGPLQSVVGDLLPAVLPDGVMRAPRELPVVGDGLGVAGGVFVLFGGQG